MIVPSSDSKRTLKLPAVPGEIWTVMSLYSIATVAALEERSDHDQRRRGMTRRIVTQCESIDADFFMISVIRNAVRSQRILAETQDSRGVAFRVSTSNEQTQSRHVIDNSGDCA